MLMLMPRALPAGCKAFTGGLESVITATPSGSTRYSALGAMLAKLFRKHLRCCFCETYLARR
jgi:hypothetical protein